MMETCVVVFSKILLAYHFVSFMTYDDGVTVGQVGKLELAASTNYMALSASTDENTNKVLARRGYTKTEYQCIIGTKVVPIWVQGKIGEKI